MKDKLNKNNVFNSLNSAFDEFKDTPPERVWDAIELDLAKKQLKKDKKRFFWVQFLSIAIVIFFSIFGIYKLVNYTHVLSDNSSVSKPPAKITDTTNIENKSTNYITPKDASNSVLEPQKNSTKNAKLIASKNINENAIPLQQTKTKDDSDIKLAHNSNDIRTNNPNEKNVPEKKITQNKINGSSKQLANVNIKKTNNSGANDTVQNNTEVNKAGTFGQNINRNETKQETQSNTDSAAIVVAKNNLDSVSTRYSDSLAVVANVSKTDTINQINNQLPTTEPNKTQSRISVMAFFSPDYSSRLLMNGNNSTASGYNKGEVPLFAFKSGLRIGYDLSDNLNIQIGATYSYMEQKSTPMNLSIDSSETEHTRYSFSTSSGIVSFSSDDFEDDDEGNLSKDKIYTLYTAKEKIQFINVPILVRYKLLNKKISAYFLGGITANFIVSKQVKLDVLNQPGSLTVNTNKISGLRSMNGGVLFGLECHYNFYKGLGVLLAPTITGSFTSINKNTPVKSYPFSLGLAAGLIYHF
ncbi:MAG: hypothetical protein Q8L81_18175 [Bacteroidota bacterium]|nr:hypothetical protein [Bacteroidota bacterium]